MYVCAGVSYSVEDAAKKKLQGGRLKSYEGNYKYVFDISAFLLIVSSL
jgi:hypothetical protein